jgi:hypothetical protein
VEQRVVVTALVWSSALLSLHWPPTLILVIITGGLQCRAAAAAGEGVMVNGEVAGTGKEQPGTIIRHCPVPIHVPTRTNLRLLMMMMMMTMN